MTFVRGLALLGISVVSAGDHGCKWVRQEPADPSAVVPISFALPYANQTKLEALWHAVADPAVITALRANAFYRPEFSLPLTLKLSLPVTFVHLFVPLPPYPQFPSHQSPEFRNFKTSAEVRELVAPDETAKGEVAACHC